MFCSGANWSALVSSLSCEHSDLLYEKVHLHCPALPILSLHPVTCDRANPLHALSWPIMHRPHSLLLQLLYDLQNQLFRRTDQMQVLFDQSIPFETVWQFQNGLSNQKPLSTPWKFTRIWLTSNRNSNEEDEENVSLERLDKWAEGVAHQHQIVVIGQSLNLLRVILAADKHHLITSNRRWIVLFTDRPSLLILKQMSNHMQRANMLLLHPHLEVHSQSNPQSATIHQFECELTQLMNRLSEPSMTEILTNLNRTRLQTLPKSEHIKYKQSILQAIRMYLDHRHGHDWNATSVGNLSSFQPCHSTRYQLQAIERTRNSIGRTETIGWPVQHVTYEYEFDLFVNPMNRHVSNAYRKRLKQLAKAKSEFEANNLINSHLRSRLKRSIERHRMNLVERSSWTAHRGFLNAESIESRHINSWSGRHLKVAVVTQMPLIQVQVLDDGSCIVNGSSSELLQVLQQQLNFTYEWYCSKQMESEGIGWFDTRRATWTGNS